MSDDDITDADWSETTEGEGARRSEKATDPALGRLGSEKPEDEQEEYPDSEHATETVEPHVDADQRSRAFVIVAAILAAIVIIILLLILLLRGLGGGIDSKFCPGTDLANEVDKGGNRQCNQEITTD